MFGRRNRPLGNDEFDESDTEITDEFEKISYDAVPPFPYENPRVDGGHYDDTGPLGGHDDTGPLGGHYVAESLGGGPYEAVPFEASRAAYGLYDAQDPDDHGGPYDIAEVEELLDEFIEQRLDLGSVVLPVPDGIQLQVEMAPDGAPQAVHLTNEHGRITVSAYAAPKTAGQWRDVATDLAESLRSEHAAVSVEDGPWGRELLASTDGADLRFIGVDGYRWMLRLVVAGPAGSVGAGAALVETAHAVLLETVVRRGEDPHPVRTPLPVVLPQQLAEQLAAAHQQQLAMQAAEEATEKPAPPLRPAVAPVIQTSAKHPRRGADGSAMQQMRR